MEGLFDRTFHGRAFLRALSEADIDIQPPDFSYVDVSHVVTHIGDKCDRWQAYGCDNT